HGGMCQNRQVEQAGLFETADSLRRLGHLHQTEDPFLHSRSSAASGNNNDRKLLRNPIFKPAGDLLPNHTAHASTDETEINDSQYTAVSFDLGLSDQNCVIKLSC